MSRAEGLSWYTCDLVDRWPASAGFRVKVCWKGAGKSSADASVLLSLTMGNAYVVGVGDTVTEAIWDLDRSFRTLVTGARFAVDVLMAITQRPKPTYRQMEREKAIDAHACTAYKSEEGDEGFCWECGAEVSPDNSQCGNDHEGELDVYCEFCGEMIFEENPSDGQGDAWSGGFAENH